MGSGDSSLYYGTGGGSQPFSYLYSVVPEMKRGDMKDADIYDNETGYYKNPSAIKLEDAIIGNVIYLQGRVAHGKMTYVMDANGNIIFGKRMNPNNPRARSPHPMLLGGRNPKVICAGMITFNNGRILKVDNDSGHFRPHHDSMVYVNNALNKLYSKQPQLFDRNSKWRK